MAVVLAAVGVVIVVDAVGVVVAVFGDVVVVVATVVVVFVHLIICLPKSSVLFLKIHLFSQGPVVTRILSQEIDACFLI